jgi:hypothetical protein
VKLRFVVVDATVSDVEVGVADFRVERRSEVSLRTSTRSSRDARTPLPCVLPSADHCIDEIVVKLLCCCVSRMVASSILGSLTRGVRGVITEAVSWLVRWVVCCVVSSLATVP